MQWISEYICQHTTFHQKQTPARSVTPYGTDLSTSPRCTRCIMARRSSCSSPCWTRWTTVERHSFTRWVSSEMSQRQPLTKRDRIWQICESRPILPSSTQNQITSKISNVRSNIFSWQPTTDEFTQYRTFNHLVDVLQTTELSCEPTAAGMRPN